MLPAVKIRGLNALRCVDGESLPTPATPRLTKGPGYRSKDIAGVSALDWPTYRHDAMRHGTTATAVSNDLGVGWEVELPGPLTPPVAASGRVFVAARDEHTIYALDADTGNVNWSFIAGARIDSPPTLYKGKVLFGCTDGYLYCVTFEKGELDWRFRAAPAERRIMIEDQLESVWPVSGSVLVVNDVVYCAAGRSSMVDGGIWLYVLRPATGELQYETRVNTLKKARDDYQGTPVVPAYTMEGTHSDILVSEGDSIFMGTMQFDFRLKTKPTPIIMDVEKKTVGMDISKAEYTSPNEEMKKDGYEKYRALAGNWWIERTWPKFMVGGAWATGQPGVTLRRLQDFSTTPGSTGHTGCIPTSGRGFITGTAAPRRDNSLSSVRSGPMHSRPFPNVIGRVPCSHRRPGVIC